MPAIKLAAAPTDSAHSPIQSAGARSAKPLLLGSFGSGTGMRFSQAADRMWTGPRVGIDFAQPRLGAGRHDAAAAARYIARMLQILLALAGLMGAAGIMLTAAGAHGKPGAGLDSAGYLLLIHALALLAGAAVLREALLYRPLALVALWAFTAGAVLFAADVASRAYLGSRLFPFAAPAGGMIMIAGWLVLAVSALIALRG